MIRLIVALQIFLAAAAARLRDQRGQSSVEYLGIVVVAAILVLVLVGAAQGWGTDIASAITSRIGEIAGSS